MFERSLGLFITSLNEIVEAFDSPRLGLTQIKSNISEIEQLIGTYLDANPPKLVQVTDRKASLKTFKITFDSLPPNRVRFLTATSISELRHCLDQATCAAVYCLSGDEPANLYFPKGNSKNDFDRRIERGYPEQLQEVFKGFRVWPANNGEQLGNELISDLIKAAQSKHRIYCRAIGTISHLELGTIRFEQGRGNGDVCHIPPKTDPAKNEIILGSI